MKDAVTIPWTGLTPKECESSRKQIDESHMKTIHVTRDGRPATDAELQAAVNGEPLPNATHALVNGQPLSLEQAAALRKPPLGAEPRQIWLEKRAHNLARAIHEYLGAGLHEPIAEWTRELAELWAEIGKGRP